MAIARRLVLTNASCAKNPGRGLMACSHRRQDSLVLFRPSFHESQPSFDEFCLVRVGGVTVWISHNASYWISLIYSAALTSLVHENYIVCDSDACRTSEKTSTLISSALILVKYKPLFRKLLDWSVALVALPKLYSILPKSCSGISVFTERLSY